MPSWPLIGLALHDGQMVQALEHVRGLLEPTRQPMAEDLREALEASLGGFEREDLDAARTELERAARLATREGYL